MKSVGEVMAIGRTFQESLQKALRSLETGLTGLDEVAIEASVKATTFNAIRAALGRPSPDGILKVAQAMRLGNERHADSRLLQDRSLVPRPDPRHRRYGRRDQRRGLPASPARSDA